MFLRLEEFDIFLVLLVDRIPLREWKIHNVVWNLKVSRITYHKIVVNMILRTISDERNCPFIKWVMG